MIRWLMNRVLNTEHLPPFAPDHEIAEVLDRSLLFVIAMVPPLSLVVAAAFRFGCSPARNAGPTSLTTAPWRRSSNNDECGFKS